MANEIQVSIAISVYKPGTMSGPVGKALLGQFDMSGQFVAQDSMLVQITATQIYLGAISSPHWAFFQNMDPNNYISIMSGSSGAVLIQLYPGEGCVVPLAINCTPYAIANSAPCVMDYLIASF